MSEITEWEEGVRRVRLQDYNPKTKNNNVTANTCIKTAQNVQKTAIKHSTLIRLF